MIVQEVRFASSPVMTCPKDVEALLALDHFEKMNNSRSEPCPPRPILILDFGSQYSHLIVRRCREIGAYSEMLRCDTPLDVIQGHGAAGIILSGGPSSVYEAEAPHVPEGFWDAIEVPVLGICYGLQEMQHALGGAVEPSRLCEYGNADVKLLPTTNDALFAGVPECTTVWMSHGDKVTSLAPGFEAIATSQNSPYAAVVNKSRNMWGLQFHPEVTHTSCGQQLLTNFVQRVCGVSGKWDMNVFARFEIPRLVSKIGQRHVIGALSGGVDSTVAAALLHAAIGDRFHGFMVDTGLLRKGEGPEVIERLKNILPHLQIELIDASDKFLNSLKGVTDPEQKRKIIGNLFIESFVQATEELKSKYSNGSLNDAFLLQGTLYPDVIESVSFKGPSHTIKTHHNVGGLPEVLGLELLEPLRELFKDEVRQLGIKLGLEHATVWRHPFPGPGLAIRIIGEVTKERAEILREADSIFLEEIKASGDYVKIGQSSSHLENIWSDQAFAVLLPDCRTVGVMGDQRTYGMTCCLRAIETSDYMTGDWYDMPREVLKRTSTRIINEIRAINRVCYDISSKPPATIEWE